MMAEPLAASAVSRTMRAITLVPGAGIHVKQRRRCSHGASDDGQEIPFQAQELVTSSRCSDLRVFWGARGHVAASGLPRGKESRSRKPGPEKRPLLPTIHLIQPLTSLSLFCLLLPCSSWKGGLKEALDIVGTLVAPVEPLRFRAGIRRKKRALRQVAF